MSLKVKVILDEEVRRLQVDKDISFSNLKFSAGSIFNIQEEFEMLWVDDEGDRCICKSDKELAEAIRVMSEAAQVIRFVVRKKSGIGVDPLKFPNHPLLQPVSIQTHTELSDVSTNVNRECNPSLLTKLGNNDGSDFVAPDRHISDEICESVPPLLHPSGPLSIPLVHDDKLGVSDFHDSPDLVTDYCDTDRGESNDPSRAKQRGQSEMGVKRCVRGTKSSFPHTLLSVPSLSDKKSTAFSSYPCKLSASATSDSYPISPSQCRQIQKNDVDSTKYPHVHPHCVPKGGKGALHRSRKVTAMKRKIKKWNAKIGKLQAKVRVAETWLIDSVATGNVLDGCNPDDFDSCDCTESIVESPDLKNRSAKDAELLKVLMDKVKGREAITKLALEPGQTAYDLYSGLLGIDTPTTCMDNPKASPSLKCLENLSMSSDMWGSGVAVAPGKVFTIHFLAENDGTENWPADAKLVQRGGYPVSNSCPMALYDRNRYLVVTPGTECVVSIQLKAPDDEGRFVSLFQAETADGQPFGDLLKSDIVVKAERSKISTSQNSDVEYKQSFAYKPIVEVPTTHSCEPSTTTSAVPDRPSVGTQRTQPTERQVLPDLFETLGTATTVYTSFLSSVLEQLVEVTLKTGDSTRDMPTPAPTASTAPTSTSTSTSSAGCEKWSLEMAYLREMGFAGAADGRLLRLLEEHCIPAMTESSLDSRGMDIVIDTLIEWSESLDSLE